MNMPIGVRSGLARRPWHDRRADRRHRNAAGPASRAWCWVTELQATGTGSWSFADGFETRYSERSERNLTKHETRFHRASGLLRIAASWSALATRPDLTRRVIDEAIAVVAR
jgi:hypothetical protein